MCCKNMRWRTLYYRCCRRRLSTSIYKLTKTELVLRQSWKEGIIPCLAINKIDRIIGELQMSSTDAYYHIFKIIQEVLFIHKFRPMQLCQIYIKKQKMSIKSTTKIRFTFLLLMGMSFSALV